jgi:hypothetical protein
MDDLERIPNRVEYIGGVGSRIVLQPCPLAFGELCSVSERTNINAMVKCPFFPQHPANLDLQESDAIEKR